MIVVATANFELYHGVVNELRQRDAEFTTIDPGDPLPREATVVITGPSDTVESDTDLRRITADPTAPRDAVDRALAGSRDRTATRVVGVDPGTRPGIAVLEDDNVIAAFHVPIGRAGEVIQDEVSDSVNPVVRIGNGARLHGARLVESLQDVRVELVDETGSTPHLGSGARGMGDVIAAINIALRPGEPVERRQIQPTPGELQTIQTTAREQSPENRTIPESLARQVATGNLTIAEALATHRDTEE